MDVDPAVQAAAEAIAGCASDEFAEMERPQRVWYLNLADAALKAAAPLIRRQAFTEAATFFEKSTEDAIAPWWIVDKLRDLSQAHPEESQDG